MKYKHKFDELIKSLCKQYHIKKFTDMNTKLHKNDYKFMYGVKSMHYNLSNICGKELIIGFYINPNLKLISVLHEIGHTLTSKKSTCLYEEEKEAWEIAFKLAENHKIKLNNSTINWAKKQLETYIKPEYL